MECLAGTGPVLTYSDDGSILAIASPGSGKTDCNVYHPPAFMRRETLCVRDRGQRASV